MGLKAVGRTRMLRLSVARLAGAQKLKGESKEGSENP